MKDLGGILANPYSRNISDTVLPTLQHIVSADGGTSLRNRSGLFIQIKENNFTVKLSNSTGKSSLITALMIPKIAQ